MLFYRFDLPVFIVAETFRTGSDVLLVCGKIGYQVTARDLALAGILTPEMEIEIEARNERDLASLAKVRALGTDFALQEQARAS